VDAVLIILLASLAAPAARRGITWLKNALYAESKVPAVSPPDDRDPCGHTRVIVSAVTLPGAR
jgi:hypothetical protein